MNVRAVSPVPKETTPKIKGTNNDQAGWKGASTTPRVPSSAIRDGGSGHFPVPVMEHRIRPESSVPMENTRLPVAGAEFHPEQIYTGGGPR
jgi:hypothetical protein